MKVKHFTHNDLDGVSCAIVSKKAFGENNVDVTYCDYGDVNEKITKFINDNEDELYDAIFITDISVSEETAYLLDHITNDNIVLLDHHETADWLNQLPWATVSMKHDDGRPSSGATLLFEYLYDNGHFEHLSAKEYAAVMSYTEHVRLYDTWQWVDWDEAEPNNYNTLFWFYGRTRWVNLVMKSFKDSGHYTPSSNDRMVLGVLAEQVANYINKVEKKLVTTTIGKYTVGVVFAEQHINDVAHALHERYPDLDLVAVVNMKSEKISYRTNREDIDVSKFARYFGGGGRQATAGSEIEADAVATIIRTIFRF